MNKTKVPCPKCGTTVTAIKNTWMVQWQCKNCGSKNYIVVDAKLKPPNILRQTERIKQ